MRKIFATLKSVVAAALVVSMTLAVSCSYDDTAVKNDIKNLKGDLAELTERVAALEESLQAQAPTLEELLDGKAVIVEVTTNENGDQIIKLSNGKEITVLAPAACECDEPLQYRVVDGVLEVSADGTNWVAINGVAAEQVVADVVINEDGSATIKLANGEEFTVGVAELIEFEATRTQAYVKAGETKEIAFAINDAVEDINVMNQPLGWKATVNAATRAAGGQDYVLAVTAPKYELLASGIAEKEGEVLVHFNTAAGACKVLKLAVNLAEITVEMDRTGHMLITNTLVDSYIYTSWEGEELIQEFNNYYIAVMGIDDYTEDLASIFNANWGEFDVPNVSGWVNNFYMNVNDRNSEEDHTFVEGVNEDFVFDVTVEELINTLDWYGMFEYEKNSFVVVVMPTDPQNQGKPILEQAITVPFKQLNVDVKVVKEECYNVYFDATLRGAQCYNLYPASLTEINQYVELGYYASVEEFFAVALESYLAQPNFNQFGMKVEADVKEENISLVDLCGYTMDYAPYITIAPNTEYVLAILAEEEGRTEYTVEDIQFVYYTTPALKAAETPAEYTIEYNAEDYTYTRIALDVTVPNNTVRAYYNFYDQQQLEEDVLINELINGYNEVTADEFAEMGYTFFAGKDTDLAGQQKHFYLLIVNAEGEYTLAYKVVNSMEAIVNEATVAIESVVFAPESATITLSGLEGLEIKAIQYYIVPTDAYSYYLRSEEELQDIAYGDNWMYKSSEVNPIVATQTADYKYSFAAGTTYRIAVGVQFADGTVSAPLFGEYEYPEPEPVDVVATGAAARFDSNNSYATIVDFQLPNEETASVAFRTGDGGWDNNLYFNKGLNYINAGQWNTYGDKGTSTVWYTNAYLNGNQAEVKGAIEVGYADGAYSFTFRIGYYNVTYTGAVEGLVEPEVTSADLEQPAQLPNTENLTLSLKNYAPYTGYCNVAFEDPNGKNVIVISLNDCPLVDCTYTVESSSATSEDPGTMYLNGCYVEYDGYQAGTSAYLKSGSVDVKANDDSTYTITFDLVLDNDQAYTGVFTGAIQ